MITIRPTLFLEEQVEAKKVVVVIKFGRRNTKLLNNRREILFRDFFSNFVVENNVEAFLVNTVAESLWEVLVLGVLGAVDAERSLWRNFR